MRSIMAPRPGRYEAVPALEQPAEQLERRAGDEAAEEATSLLRREEEAAEERSASDCTCDDASSDRGTDASTQRDQTASGRDKGASPSKTHHQPQDGEAETGICRCVGGGRREFLSAGRLHQCSTHGTCIAPHAPGSGQHLPGAQPSTHVPPPHRICLEDDVVHGLESPCTCVGTSRHVHHACLQVGRTGGVSWDQQACAGGRPAKPPPA